ncbi:hypothetical protein N0V83_002484 [Neocucurbitaria cava]|uniref:Uncharacterized protein n=1 Tax=Neocucurbitaria cava TaxID=798079 RepID=A0A9W9CQU1_9PLEO|nr:hypothetical protein N0V83_002484 [Neocucurbitaria cava]
MADATVSALVNIVGQILANPAKVNVTNYASELKGGWEIWIQVEMACALADNNVVAYREEHVYRNNTNLKTDVKVLVPGTNECISVELKVQSKGQTDFIKVIFNTDTPKLLHGFNGDIVKACGMIVLTILTTIAEFNKLLMDGPNRFQRFPTQVGTTLVANDVNTTNAVYWWALDVDTTSGKPIVKSDSPEVFVEWVDVQPELFIDRRNTH